MNKELLKNWIGFVKKHFLVIIICFCIGLAVGFVKYFSARPYYKTTCLAYSDLISNNRIADIITEVQFRLGKKEYKLLSKVLDVSPDLLKDINKIECHTITQESQNPFIENNFFKLDISYYNPLTVDSFKNSIIKYVNNIDYLKKKKDLKNKHNHETIVKIDEEINNYNKLLSKIISSFDETEKSTKNQYITTSGSDQIIDLFQRKELLSEKLILAASPVVIVQDIMVSDNPVSFGLGMYLFLYTFFFILVGFSILGIWIFVKEFVL